MPLNRLSEAEKSHSSALAAQETDLILHESPSEYLWVPGYVSKPLQYEYDTADLQSLYCVLIWGSI